MLELKLIKSKVLDYKFADSNVYPNDEEYTNTPIKLKVDFSKDDNNKVGGKIAITTTIKFGKEDEFVFIQLKVVSLFEIVSCDDEEEINNEYIEKYYLPVSTKIVREYFDNLTKALGYPDIELPVFSFEE
ncbi:MAG: hypothetical protein UIM53_07510 [Acutalibacteraceae bacterium]|nr:hypothetical protein [Acutalibacteraceae bacterium]